MPITIAQQLAELVSQKEDLADNLTTMGVSSNHSEKLNTLVPKVLEIQTGTDTSDATADANKILDGYTAYVNGNKIFGTIQSKSAETITPSTTNQIIPSGKYLSGDQTILGDANLVSSNIKSGIEIFGVSGDSNIVDTSDATATSNDLVSGKTAYSGGTKIIGAGNVMDTTEDVSTTASASNVQQGMSAYVNGQKIVGECVSMDGYEYTSSNVDQIITGPKILQGNKTMTIKGDSNLAAENIKDGVSIFSTTGTFSHEADNPVSAGDMKNGKVAYVNGNKITGNAYTRTSQVNAVADGLIDGTSHWLQAGFYNGIAFEAEPNLIASNIKKGVNIYGVTGTYEQISKPVLLETSDLTTTQEVLDRYGGDKYLIQVSTSGDRRTWDLFDTYDYTNNRVGAYGSNNYRGIYFRPDSSVPLMALFNTKIQLKSEFLIKYQYYVSTWINSSIHLYLIAADSLAEVKTKLLSDTIAYDITLNMPNATNNTDMYRFVDNVNERYYYIALELTTAPGGNEFLFTDLSFINM